MENFIFLVQTSYPIVVKTACELIEMAIVIIIYLISGGKFTAFQFERCLGEVLCLVLCC